MTRREMLKLAGAGVAGGARDHVERNIALAEASVIRRIFEEIAAGRGFSRLAKGSTRRRSPARRRAVAERRAACASSCCAISTAALAESE